jgi:hypothetical protein
MYDNSVSSSDAATKTRARQGSILRSPALRTASLFLVAILALGLGLASGQSNPAPRSDADLLVRYMTWTVRTQFAGLGMADHLGLNQFIPLPTADYTETAPDGAILLVGSVDVSIRAKQFLVLPILAFTGEKYAGDLYPPDPPNAKDVFTGAPVLVTLDGVTIVDSKVDSLNDLFFGSSTVDGVHVDATYFPAPIRYKEPIDRGGPIAIAAIWVQGIGIVLPPLPPGSHQIVLTAVFNEVFNDGNRYGYLNTFNITVE